MNVSTAIDTVLGYAERGWPVIPLHSPIEPSTEFPSGCDCRKKDCEDQGKHPRTRNGVKDASTDPARIREWATWGRAAGVDVNWGISLAGAHLLDIAPDSPEWLETFTARGLPPTAYYLSGGGDGHAHYLYLLPEGERPNRRCVSGQYDLLSDGYAIVPPSRHRSGEYYRWVTTPQDIVLAPDWGVQAARRTPKEAAAFSTPDWGVEADPYDLARLHYLIGPEMWDNSDGHGLANRSEFLWILGKELRKRGASAATIFAVMAERDTALDGFQKYSHRPDAPHEYLRETRRAIRDVGDEPLRVGEAEALLRSSAPPRNCGAAEEDAQIRIWAQAELRALEIEKPVFLIDGLLAPGCITETDGFMKAGKSTFAMAMVRALSRGEEFLGRATTQVKILYLTEQGPNSAVPQLYDAGLLDDDDTARVMFYVDALEHRWPEIVRQARDAAVEWGAGLVVVDTLGEWSKIRGDTENDAGKAYEIMEPLKQLVGANIATLVLRHDRKTGGNVGYSARGSSAYGGIADIILHLTEYQATQQYDPETRFRLLEGKGRFEETPRRIVVELMKDKPYLYVTHGTEDVFASLLVEGQLLAVLPTSAEHALTLAQVCEATGMKKDTARRWLARFERGGRIAAEKPPVGSTRGYRYYQSPVKDGD